MQQMSLPLLSREKLCPRPANPSAGDGCVELTGKDGLPTLHRRNLAGRDGVSRICFSVLAIFGVFRFCFFSATRCGGATSGAGGKVRVPVQVAGVGQPFNGAGGGELVSGVDLDVARLSLIPVVVDETPMGVALSVLVFLGFYDYGDIMLRLYAKMISWEAWFPSSVFFGDDQGGSGDFRSLLPDLVRPRALDVQTWTAVGGAGFEGGDPEFVEVDVFLWRLMMKISGAGMPRVEKSGWNGGSSTLGFADFVCWAWFVWALGFWADWGGDLVALGQTASYSAGGLRRSTTLNAVGLFSAGLDGFGYGLGVGLATAHQAWTFWFCLIGLKMQLMLASLME